MLRATPLPALGSLGTVVLSGHAGLLYPEPNSPDHQPDSEEDPDYEGQPSTKRSRTDPDSPPKPKKPRIIQPKLSKPWTYELGPGGLALQKNRKDLNISQGYGKEDAWTRTAGLRELIQNMFDGILSHLRTEDPNANPRDIEVNEVHSYTGPGRLKGSLMHVQFGQTITFEFRHRQDQTIVPSKRKGKTKVDLPLGWFSFKALQYGSCHLELYNGGLPIKLEECLTFGNTSKEGKTGFIGQHGDGMKMGINAIIRQSRQKNCTSPSVIFVTGKNHWDFRYDDYDSLTAHPTHSKLPNVKGILTQVRDFPTGHVKFHEFLFLKPPLERLEASSEAKGSRIGSVLLDEQHKQSIFVKGVFVQKKQRNNGLKYGVDIWHDVHIGRDRVGLEDDVECAEAVYQIWQSLFPESPHARQLFVSLLLESPECIEAQFIADEEFMTLEDGEILFKQLREDKGNVSFFYDAHGDTTEAVRIIEQVLKRKPVPIPKQFHAALLRHDIIRTPEQQRKFKFKGFEVSDRYDDQDSQVGHTHHIVEAFLSYDASTMECYRGRYKFKEAPVETGVEVVPDGEGGSLELLFHDLTLSRVYIHDKPQFKMCSRYLMDAGSTGNSKMPVPTWHNQAPQDTGEGGSLTSTELKGPLSEPGASAHSEGSREPSPEDSSSEMGPTKDFWPEMTSVCDCSALHILNLMTQELQDIPASRKHEINMGRQMALKSMPRDLAFEFLDEDTGKRVEPVLSWSVDDASLDFKVIIREDTDIEPLLTNIVSSSVTEVVVEETNQQVMLSEAKDSYQLEDQGGQTPAMMVEDEGESRREGSPILIDNELEVAPATPNLEGDNEGNNNEDGLTVAQDELAVPPSSRSSAGEDDVELKTWDGPDTFSSPEILLRSANTKIVLNEHLMKGIRYSAQVCWDKQGTLYSPPLTFTIPPLPPLSVDAHYVDGILRIDWVDDLNSGAHHWVLKITCDDQPILEKEVNGLSWESSPDGEIEPGTRLHISIYAVASGSDTISPDCIKHEMYIPKPSEKGPRVRDAHNDTSTSSAQVTPPPEVNSSKSSRSGDVWGTGFDSTNDSDDDDGLAEDFDTEYEDESELDEDDDDEMYAYVAHKPIRIRISVYRYLDSIHLKGTVIQAGHFYVVHLKDSPNREATKVIIYVHSIKSPESGPKAVDPLLQVTRYMYWSELHDAADHSEVLMVFQDQERMGTVHDAEGFRTGDILEVFEETYVHHEPWLPNLESDIRDNSPICQWGYRARGTGMNSRDVTLVPVGHHPQEDPVLPKNPPPLPEIKKFTIGELFCGVGGSSCGFEAAGFEPSFGVDRDCIASLAFEINCRSATAYNESVQTFLQRPWSANANADPLSVLLISPPCQGFSRANSGGKNDSQNRDAVNVVPDALRKLSPAYMVGQL